MSVKTVRVAHSVRNRLNPNFDTNRSVSYVEILISNSLLIVIPTLNSLTHYLPYYDNCQ